MNKSRKYIILLLIVVISGIVLSFSFTFAKFVKDVIWEYHLNSKGFYFSSKDLDINSKDNIINDWDGSNVHFSLNNSQNELITEYDIKYSAKCIVAGEAALYTECHLNSENQSEISGILSTYQACFNNTQDGIDVSSYNKNDCEINNYEWKNQEATSNLNFNIFLTDPEYDYDNITINIEVNSTSPYTKKLKGKFILYKKDKEELITNYYDNDETGKLVLSNFKESDECINIKWDSNKLIVDLLEEFVSVKEDSNGYINELEININKKSAKELTFYKKNDAVITLEDFQLNKCQ